VAAQIQTADIVKYVFRSIKPFRLSISVMICVALYTSFTMAFNPYLIKTIINRVSMHQSGDLFTAVWPPVVVLLCLQFMLSLSYRVYDYFVNISMVPKLRGNIVEQSTMSLLQQSHNFFQNTFGGSLANKVNDLSHSIPELLQITIDRLFFLISIIFCAIVALACVNYKFAILMFVWVVLFTGWVLFNYRRIAELSEQWSEDLSTITGRVVDIFSNVLSVRLFSSKQREETFLQDAVNNSIRVEKQMGWIYLRIFLCYGVLSFILTALSIYFLIIGKQRGYLSVGDFTMVFMINIEVMNNLWMLTKDLASFSRVCGKIKQSLNIVLTTSEMADTPNAKPLVITHGSIEFVNVNFNYHEHAAIFSNKNIMIPAGQKVGLVGYSGGGKSTFVNLILRLYDITSGNILIDGQDIRSVTQDSLHDAIGMIPQDPLLFHRTLFANIQYAKPGASEQEIYAAAKRAHTDEFIAKLPHGYDSMVGERGIKLSGGQRQRIAIARAMLKNAPILILDEATSQLDSVTEHLIQDSLWELMQNKTTIVVAHRLSTLLHMDRILVFENGTVVEDGTHTALLAQGGLYKTLWAAQVGGFLPN